MFYADSITSLLAARRIRELRRRAEAAKGLLRLGQIDPSERADYYANDNSGGHM